MISHSPSPRTSSSRRSVVSLQRWMNMNEMFALKRLRNKPSLFAQVCPRRSVLAQIKLLDGIFFFFTLNVFMWKVHGFLPPHPWASGMTCVSVLVLLLFPFFWFTAEKMTLFSDPARKTNKAGFLLCTYRHSLERDLKKLMNPVSCWLPLRIGILPLFHLPCLYTKITADVPVKYELFPNRKQRCLNTTHPSPLVLFSCRPLAEVSPPDADPGPQACLTGP